LIIWLISLSDAGFDEGKSKFIQGKMAV